MCQHHHQHLAALRLITPRRQLAAHVPFHHRIHCLNLPSLPILSAVESPRHQPAIVTRRRVAPGSAVLRGEQRADAVLKSCVAMIGLAVVARVADDCLDRRTPTRCIEDRRELIHIGRRAARRHRREDDVRGGFDDQCEFRESPIRRAFPCFVGLSASTNIVTARVTRLVSRGIDGGEVRDSAAFESHINGYIKHVAEELHAEQTPRRFLERGPVWHGLHADVCGKFRAVAEQLPDAAVVGVGKSFEHQARHQLRLGELVRREPVCIVGQRIFRRYICRQRHRAG